MKNRKRLPKGRYRITLMNNEGKRAPSRYRAVWLLMLGELLVAALTVGVYAIVGIWVEGAFGYKVITGAALGAFAATMNFFALNFTVNRAIDKYMTARGTEEMDDEQAAKFAQENALKVQNEVAKSYIVRTLILVAAMCLLFTKQFAVIATVVPLLLGRPIISLIGLLDKEGKK